VGDFGFYNSQENSNHDTMNYTIYLCMFRKELGRGSAFIRGAATKPMSFLLYSINKKKSKLISQKNSCNKKPLMSILRKYFIFGLRLES
jgi:hypothetical protein